MKQGLYFFYGTLLDADIRLAILGWRTPKGGLEAAHLEGFCRVYVDGERYPGIFPEAGSRVEGTLAMLTAEEAARLAHYESSDYDPQPVQVTGVRRNGVSALTYFPGPTESPSSTPWELLDWQHRHKARFLEIAEGWMNGSGVWVNAKGWPKTN